MNSLTLLADIGALLVLTWAAFVFARFVTGYPGYRGSDRERENAGERR